MAEENSSALPDLPDADIPIPPIDNIHAPKSEPDLYPGPPPEQHPQTMYPGVQFDTEMSEAAVRILQLSHHICKIADLANH